MQEIAGFRKLFWNFVNFIDKVQYISLRLNVSYATDQFNSE